MRFVVTLLLVCVTSLLLGATQASAAARVTGRVKDALDRPLSGVRVRLQAADGRVVAEATTGADGDFVFDGVAPGTYSVQGSHADFEEGVAIVTVSDNSAKADLVLASKNPLDLGLAAKQLDIARNGITPSTGSSVYAIPKETIQAMPQADNAPFNQVVLRAPGVAQDSFGQFHIRGDHANIQYRINGVQLPEGISGFGQALDPRFVDRLDLIDGALPAQFGFRTAGILDIETKNGAYDPGGTVSVYGGSRSTIHPSVEYGGSTGQVSYYATGDFLYNTLGIESPTPTINALHDRTNQTKGFAYLSGLLDPTTRLSFISGNFIGHFNIPNNPGQDPAFTVAGLPDPNSANLDETQSEFNNYGVLALQKSMGDLDFQVAAFSRYSKVVFRPDSLGDVAFNGVASHTFKSDFANGLQADGSYRLAETHTLRGGMFFQGEQALSHDGVDVLPVDAMGMQTSDVPFLITDRNSKLGYLYGAYLQDEWRPFTQLTVNFGARYDYMAEFVHTGQLSPRINAVYKPTATTTLHAGYSRYFTPPPLELVTPTDIALFEDTTNQAPGTQDSAVVPERAHYFDAGVIQQVVPGFQVGADAYYKRAKHLLDEGQFGQAIIFSPFNYKEGYAYGAELTATWSLGPFTAFANLAYSIAKGRQIESSQFEFDPDELAYIQRHFVHLDHDQTYTSSLGASYLWYDTRFTVDLLMGSGLRKGFANTQKLPTYEQANLGVSHKFNFDQFGGLTARFDIINVFDASYELRDGSGIGVGAPQFGPRRAYYVGLAKDF